MGHKPILGHKQSNLIQSVDEGEAVKTWITPSSYQPIRANWKAISDLKLETVKLVGASIINYDNLLQYILFTLIVLNSANLFNLLSHYLYNLLQVLTYWFHLLSPEGDLLNICWQEFKVCWQEFKIFLD